MGCPMEGNKKEVKGKFNRWSYVMRAIVYSVGGQVTGGECKVDEEKEKEREKGKRRRVEMRNKK